MSFRTMELADRMNRRRQSLRTRAQQYGAYYEEESSSDSASYDSSASDSDDNSSRYERLRSYSKKMAIAAAAARELYCLCGLLHKESNMIQCSQCLNWFHPKCVQLDQDQSELCNKFVCGVCNQDDNDIIELLVGIRGYNSEDSSDDLYRTNSSMPNSPNSSSDYENGYTKTIIYKPEQATVITHSPSDITKLLNSSDTEPIPFIYNGTEHRNMHIVEQRSPPSSMAIPLSPARSRKRKSEIQMAILMRYYQQNPDPDLASKKRIAEETCLSVKQVSDWFYNLRVRKKFKR